jgi:hypothetical protein
MSASRVNHDEHAYGDRSALKELLAALSGAAITSVVQALFLLQTNAQFNLIPFALAAITGGIIGWGYQLAATLRRTSNRALVRLEEATLALDLQQEPLSMILSANRHKGLVTRLVERSLRDDFKRISYVNEPQYLNFLTSAIRVSNKSTGVKRQPVRSYRDHASRMMKEYLHSLRDKAMKEKTRIFIIDEEDKKKMEDDLDDSELMNFYWTNAGTDVNSYWITVDDFKEYFSGRLAIPQEFAVYDDELLIQYDGRTRTLMFDLVQPGDERLEIFQQLAEQEENKMDGPFTKIEPPKAVKAS